MRPGPELRCHQIKADGPKALGEQQAQACRGAQTLASPSQVLPGKEGQVFRDFCFKPSCHATLVAKHGLAQAELRCCPGSRQGASQASLTSNIASTDVEQADKPAAPKKATGGATSTGTVTAAVTSRLKVWRRCWPRACGGTGSSCSVSGDAGLTTRLTMWIAESWLTNLVFETGDKLKPPDRRAHGLGTRPRSRPPQSVQPAAGSFPWGHGRFCGRQGAGGRCVRSRLAPVRNRLAQTLRRR